MADSKSFKESNTQQSKLTPNETLELLNHVTVREWSAILQKAEEYEVDKGTSPKHRFEVRRKKDAPSPVDAKIIYWGRDGWTEGFTHAEIFAERLTNSAVTVYAQRSDDDEAMKLTRLNRKVEPFIESALNNLDSKDTLGDEHGQQ